MARQHEVCGCAVGAGVEERGAGELVAQDLFGVLGECLGEVVEGFVVGGFVEVFFGGGLVVEVCYAGAGGGGLVRGWAAVYIFGFCVEVEVREGVGEVVF